MTSRRDEKATVLTSKTVFRGKVLELTIDRVQLPGGPTTELELLRHPGASATVPLDDGGRVLLLRQYRHAADGWIYEVPAGKRSAGEAPEACAIRETSEETGFRPGRLTPMGWIWTTPGFTDERIWLFLARDLEPVERALDPDEILEPEWMDLDRAVDLAASGGIQDAKSVCALLRTPLALRLEG